MDALHIVITFHLAAITELLEQPFQGTHNHRETQVRESDKFFHVVVPVFQMLDNHKKQPWSSFVPWDRTYENNFFSSPSSNSFEQSRSASH